MNFQYFIQHCSICRPQKAGQTGGTAERTCRGQDSRAGPPRVQTGGLHSQAGTPRGQAGDRTVRLDCREDREGTGQSGKAAKRTGRGQDSQARPARGQVEDRTFMRDRREDRQGTRQ